MTAEERVKFMNIFSLVMKRTIIYRYLNKSTNIALDMYLIALFCDEPCALLCIVYDIKTKTYELFES